METLTENSTSQIISCVNLQLAGAAINQNGMLSIKQLYSNLRRFGGLEISYSEFIECLESSRDDLNIRDGQVGIDVNYISIKKG